MIIASATQFHILLPWGQLIVQLRRLVVDSTIHLPPPALTHTLFEYCLNLNSHVIVNWDTDCKDAISDMLIVVTGPTRPVTRRCSPREDLLPTEARP